MTTATSTAGTITVFAPAKVNLFLHVRGRKPNGYHLLESLVVFCGVGDTLTFAPADGLTLIVTGSFASALSAEADNLVLRAARTLARYSGAAAKAAIVLEKSLPVAAGIGGGSADAAAALIGCGQLWNAEPRHIPADILVTELGADVPVCLAGGPAFMSGVGEIVHAVPALPSAWLTLVNPGRTLATRDVFGAMGGQFGAPTQFTPERRLTDAAELAAVLAGERNDLTAPAAAIVPEIGTALRELAAAPGCLLARLSGSGPTCFGLFGDGSAAETAAAQISARQPGWWIKSGAILGPRTTSKA